MSRMGCMLAAWIVAMALAGCSTSTPVTQTSATIPTSPAAATAPARGRQAANWDVDGDGRRDRARLVYLGGYGGDNGGLVVDMTRLCHQIIRFTGEVVLTGNVDAPTFDDSVDA